MAIEKGKVELERDAIAPVMRSIWHAACEKLQEAQVGVEQMQSAKNRIEYEAGWTRFVDSLEEFWTRFFDEGRNKFPSFQPWAGAIVAKRKKDPLLSYLRQARHQSQHGRIVLDWEEEEGRIQIGGGEFFGTVRDLKMWGDGTYEADVNSSTGSDAKFKVVHAPGNPRLPVVLNKKHRQRFTPPTRHLGQPLADSSPVSVARLGVAYYDGVLRQGLIKFEQAP